MDRIGIVEKYQEFESKTLEFKFPNVFKIERQRSDEDTSWNWQVNVFEKTRFIFE